MPSAVNMIESAVAKSTGRGYVFGMGKIVMRFAEQPFCIVEAIHAGQVCIDRRMVVEVLAVIDGGTFDLADSSVDLLDRAGFAIIYAAVWPQLIKIGTGKTEIAQSMEISRMRTGYLLGLSTTAEEASGEEGE